MSLRKIFSALSVRAMENNTEICSFKIILSFQHDKKNWKNMCKYFTIIIYSKIIKVRASQHLTIREKEYFVVSLVFSHNNTVNKCRYRQILKPFVNNYYA